MKDKPEKRIKCGPISASIWAEGRVVNGEMVKFYSIDMVYKKEDEWVYTKRFRPEDLPKVALVANEAFKYIKLSSTDEEN